MPQKTLEARVAALETQILEIKKAQVAAQQKDWQRIVGMFDGNEDMRRIFEEALKYRERDRARARLKREEARRTRKSKRTA